jgi:hypothetical protein
MAATCSRSTTTGQLGDQGAAEDTPRSFHPIFRRWRTSRVIRWSRLAQVKTSYNPFRDLDRLMKP